MHLLLFSFLICHLILLLVTHYQNLFNLTSINFLKDSRKANLCQVVSTFLSKQPPLYLWQLTPEPWICLGKKHCQLVAALTREGHISSVIFRLNFKTTLENRLRGLALETACKQLQKSGRFLTIIQFYQTAEQGAKKQAGSLLFTSRAVYKTGWACSWNQYVNQWTQADLLRFITSVLCTRTLRATLTEHPPALSQKI